MSEFLRLPDGVLLPLTDGLRLGRSPAADLTIDEPSVSRDHAVVRGHPGRWFLEDLGSRNGTRVNANRLMFGRPHPLRHEDQVRLGALLLVVVSAAESGDADRTDSMVIDQSLPELTLSPFQRQVVGRLAEPWLTGGEPAGNAQIANQLGTPEAVDAVKAALRRIYAKAGLTDDRSRAKRRELCRVAQQQGWL